MPNSRERCFDFNAAHGNFVAPERKARDKDVGAGAFLGKRAGLGSLAKEGGQAKPVVWVPVMDNWALMPMVTTSENTPQTEG